MNDTGPFTIKDLIFNGNQDPEHNAIESPGYQPLTYRELRNQVLFVVKTLNAMGYHRNDRIAVVAPAGPETAVSIISVMSGFTAVPLNPQYKEQEYQNYFSQLKVKAIIVHRDCEAAVIRAANSRAIPIIELTPLPGKAGTFELGPPGPGKIQEPEFAAPSDISHVFFTSGTTSTPKIVPVSQRQSFFIQKQHCRTLQMKDTDRCLHIVPYYHGMGIGPPLLSVLLAGGTVICPKEFIPSDFHSLLTTFRPTFYSAGPALHQGILREIKKVSPEELKNNSLRFIRSGSAALPPSVRQELETLLGVVMIEAFAMTETGEISVNFPPRPGSVGKPVIDHLEIIDENGEVLKPFEQGEIVVKGDTVFAGYEDKPEENIAAFTNGWFKTGDLGYLDNEGYLFYTGRKKELINKGGEKISPAEIDTVLMTHPSVKQAMAFRVSDRVLGEDIAAMVVVERHDVSEEDLRRYLIDRLIQFKVPKRIYFVDEIPQGPTGKLLRYVGTERYDQDGTSSKDISDTVSSEVSMNHEILQQIWKDVLDITVLSLDDDFFRCGGNSLAAIELLIKIQRTFHLTIPPDTIYRYPTIRQQALLIATKEKAVSLYHPLIVPLREHGMLPPLFWIHSLGGWIREFQSISPFLDQNRPVFGIRARGLEPSEKLVPTIEERVREYADAIKTVQKEGPYHLLGFSAGGRYAFELACQLQKKGEVITYLGIIDISAPSPQTKLFSLKKGNGSHTVIAAGYHCYRFLRNRLKPDTGSLFYSLFVKGARFCSQGILYLTDAKLLSVSEPDDTTVLGDETEKWIAATYFKEQYPLVRNQIRAFSKHRSRIFSGDITLFSTGPDSEFFPGDPSRGWNGFITGKTLVIAIPGNHETVFNETFGPVLAKKIEESLKRIGTHE